MSGYWWIFPRRSRGMKLAGLALGYYLPVRCVAGRKGKLIKTEQYLPTVVRGATEADGWSFPWIWCFGAYFSFSWILSLRSAYWIAPCQLSFTSNIFISLDWRWSWLTVGIKLHFVGIINSVAKIQCPLGFIPKCCSSGANNMRITICYKVFCEYWMRILYSWTIKHRVTKGVIGLWVISLLSSQANYTFVSLYKVQLPRSFQLFQDIWILIRS